MAEKIQEQDNQTSQNIAPQVHRLNPYLMNPPHKLTICVIGAGGNGSRMLAQLARIDHIVRHLGHPGLDVTVFDPKIVSEASIARQQYSLSDVGRSKAEVFITRLNRQFSLGWNYGCMEYDDSMANIFISCVDNKSAREKLIAMRKIVRHYNPMYNPLYWMDIGNSDYYGQFVVGTWNTNELPCINNVFPEILDDEPDSVSCSVAESISRQSPFINHILTDFAAKYIYEMLTSFSIDYHGMIINLKKNIFTKLLIK